MVCHVVVWQTIRRGGVATTRGGAREHLQRATANLVKERCAAITRRQMPGLLLVGSGKGASLVPGQLALEQRSSRGA